MVTRVLGGASHSLLSRVTDLRDRPGNPQGLDQRTTVAATLLQFSRRYLAGVRLDVGQASRAGTCC